MSTERNNDHPGRYGSVVFICDEVGCDESVDTGYTTWDYARDAIKGEGWYFFKDSRGGWEHCCPAHGKARYIEQKKAEEAQQPSGLPSWMRN